MRLNYAHPQPLPTAERRDNSIAIVAVMASLFLVVVIVTIAPAQMQSAILIGLVIAGLAALRPQAAIVVTFIYLALMGDLRRYLVTEVGVVSNDPLLLVGPAISVVLVLMALVRRQLSLHSQISKLLLVLMIVMCLEVINPLQGGITVGAAGALFYLLPLFWFWIGQAWGSSEFFEKLLTRVVVPLAVLASLLGLSQAFYGYFQYEARWFRLVAESSARPDIRPFAFFCAWGEYPFYVATALFVVLVPLAGRAGFSLLLAPLFLFALIVQSVRESIFESIFAVSMVWAMRPGLLGQLAGGLSSR